MNYNIIIILISVIVIIAIICIILLLNNNTKSQLSYYPAIQLSKDDDRKESSTFSIIQNYPPTPYKWTVPKGYTFLNNWTFNKKYGNITLEGTNTVASTNGSGTTIGNKPLQDKVMFSVAFTPNENTNKNVRIGIVTGKFTNTVLGSDKKGIAVDKSGNVYYNGEQAAVSGSPFNEKNTSYIDVAVDTCTYLFWYRVNGGIWNGNSSTNPETNEGGLSFYELTN